MWDPVVVGKTSSHRTSGTILQAGTFGAIASKKQRRIYINAFCDNHRTFRLAGAIICTHRLIDGATCFWPAVYDPVTKTFSNLTINARA